MSDCLRSHDYYGTKRKRDADSSIPAVPFVKSDREYALAAAASRRRNRRRLAAGLCVSCPEPRAGDHWRCLRCHLRSNARADLCRVDSGDMVDYAKLLEIASGVCAICSEPLGEKYHFDHIIPISKGGQHCEANIQVTHPRCNLVKGARL